MELQYNLLFMQLINQTEEKHYELCIQKQGSFHKGRDI